MKLYDYVCQECGKTFQRRKYPYIPKFCSSSCSSNHQWRNGGGHNQPLQEPPTFKCEFCGKENKRRRLYYKGEIQGFDRRRFCNHECADKAQFKGGHIHHSGYRVFTRKGKHVAEHREVMEKMICRPLKPQETVHHKNGDRQDNRPDNLELWSTRNPKGQRVEDKIAFAIDFLKDYGYSVHKN